MLAIGSVFMLNLIKQINVISAVRKSERKNIEYFKFIVLTKWRKYLTFNAILFSKLLFPIISTRQHVILSHLNRLHHDMFNSHWKFPFP